LDLRKTVSSADRFHKNGFLVLHLHWRYSPVMWVLVSSMDFSGVCSSVSRPTLNLQDRGLRGVTVKFANSPTCVCRGTSDVGISAFHSCVVVDLWQSLSEWHL
jgi:hypothetical protein